MLSNRVASNLKAFVNNLRSRHNHVKPPSLRPRSIGEPASTDAFCPDLKQVELRESEVATLAQQSSTVEAILDTGASRCVMGKGLLQTFVGQLSDSVRSKVRVQKSAIRFRFGNNQTLLSDCRILLPFGTTDHRILWLGIEVVPGRTPLLFSKRAIKQLGGIINTVTDVCELRRLRRSLRMQTGPTGLYMIDLSRLCEESHLEAKNPPIFEDSLQAPAADDPCMFSEPLDVGTKTLGCIAGPRIFRNPWGKNSSSALKHSVASAVNDCAPVPKGVPGSIKTMTAQACVQRTVAPAAAPAPSRAISHPASDPFTSSSVPNHGTEQSCVRNSGLQCPAGQPGFPLGQASGSNDEPQPCRDREPQPRKAWRFSGELRNQNEGPQFPGMRGRGVRLDQVVRGSLPRQHQTGAQDLHQLRGEVRDSGRADRGRAVRRASRHQGSQASQGEPQEQSRSKGSCPRRRSRDPLGDVGGARALRSSGDSEQSHDANGAGDAGNDHSHPSAQCTPELLLSEVAQCQRELNALVMQTSPDPVEFEARAKKLMQSQPALSELRMFLRRVPWHLFAESHARASVITPNPEAKKPLAYVSFGMYVHGGIVGITSVTKQYPWITRALTSLIQQSDPQHRFSSVGVSCNASAEPHRDVYNSEQFMNLIVPLEYPSTGGQLWVAKTPHARQPAQDRQCGSSEIPGSLVALKPAMYLNPHCWHATTPWTGDRVLAIGYCLKANHKLRDDDRSLMKSLGFRLPVMPRVRFAPTNLVDSVGVPEPSELRQELDAAAELMRSTLPGAAQKAAEASTVAFQQAEDAAWNVYQDSMLAYSQPREQQLDLLEIYVESDSRLTDQVQRLGGRAQRFTIDDGDLATADGQRKLWDCLQCTQPRHVWMSPSSRHWCSWTSLNSARSPTGAQNLKEHRQKDLVHLRLCAKVCEWQKQNARHFHLEQPIASQMIKELEFQPILKQTQQITVDMCAFGLQTPVRHVPIRKKIVILSTSPTLIRSLMCKQCPGHPEHQPLTSRLRQLLGRTHQAGSYCVGFSQHVAKQMLESRNASALTLDNGQPLTRKRFKTSLGMSQPRNSLNSQKRASDPGQSEDSQSRTKRRVDLPAPVSARNPEALPVLPWQTVFESATEHAVKASPTLVPPQSRLIDLLQEQLPDVGVLQVFVGKGCKQLQYPLGALPVTVAPWRISLCMRRPDGQAVTYQSLGQEDRTTMSTASKRARIPVTEILITIFAQGRASESVTEPGSRTEHAPAESPLNPDLEGWAPPPVPLHGPAFRNLDKDLKTQLIRAHNNLGHPDPKKLSEHLRAAGECKQLVDAALDYQCDACLESTVPRHQRPSKLPEPKEFNDVLGIDGFFFKGQSGYRAYVIHIIDESSCFHLGRRSSSRLGAEALRTLQDSWFSWAGVPKLVYLDPAGEFRSEATLEAFQKQNIKTFVSAAAWQRGRVERHGEIVKGMLSRLDKDSPITNDNSLDQALHQAFSAKNALVRHKGYAPEQIVLGKSVRVPGSVSSDEELSSHALTEGDDLEAEAHRRRLTLRSQARQAFFEADNCQTIRRAMLRRSNPVRGPYAAGSWVLYWTKKTSPNRLAAGRWHGPAKVICQEGQSVVWIAHGVTILRCAPENLRPASLREWQSLSSSPANEPSFQTGGASTFVDLTTTNSEILRESQSQPSNTSSSGSPELAVPAPVPVSGSPAAQGSGETEEDVTQPEQELTPQVSVQSETPASLDAPEVERDAAAPSESVQPTAEISAPDNLDATDIPVPDNDEGLSAETVLLASTHSGVNDSQGNDLLEFSTLHVSEDFRGPPLAEDNLPFVEHPLECSEHQAFCLEVPIKLKDLTRWATEAAPEQLATLAAISKRARAEVSVKDLTPQELKLFEQAKAKELQCWVQTSAIRTVLRRRLNPEQILKSRWILTWKSPEPGDSQPRAKARLVVLGYQDPKLVEVMRDAPTLSKEGRALVLQTIASCKFPLGSFDIKTAFLRGKADESNPLAMEPPKELRQLLNMRDDEVCQLLGNAYGRVDAPLLFYKELSSQLEALGFLRHPLEPCVFLLYTKEKLSGILGIHVDDGVCGGDETFLQKIHTLQKTLPFGSRKFRDFVFTGIRLEQMPDFTIRASQGEYIRQILPIDVGRARRQNPEAPATEAERSKLRGLVGSVQYAVTHTRPDVAAKLGEIQSQITAATVHTLLAANRVLREAQEFDQVCVHYLSIPVEKLTFVSFGDASFASSKNLNSHQGVVICATDDRLSRNEEAPLSPLAWVSKKIPRVVRSTLSAEAYAMSKAVDLLGWLRALWGVVHVPQFDWRQPERGYKLLNTAIVVTDCKSLFDLVTRLAMPSCEEHRTTLEVLLIKQRCAENAQFRWIPTTLQVADCLTKNMDASSLRAILAQGRFRLFDTSESLARDAQRRKAIEWLQQPSASLS